MWDLDWFSPIFIAKCDLRRLTQRLIGKRAKTMHAVFTRPASVFDGKLCKVPKFPTNLNNLFFKNMFFFERETAGEA